jgi:putative ABC transport system substrate-binding protein
MGKRLEVLKELSPTIARIAWLQDMRNPLSPGQWEAIKAAARSLGIEPLALDVQQPEHIGRAFDAAISQRANAIMVANDTVMSMNLRHVVDLASKQRLPAIYFSREFVDAGGLIAYSVNYPDLYRRAASYVDKIFKGAKPAELPVEQPSKFELIINLKTAKALGLDVPPTLIARADEVIE